MRRLRARLLAPVAAMALLVGSAGTASAIVGGQPSSVDANPWQVALIVQGTHPTLCSGALISETWVLTAAHCMSGVEPTRVEVYAGLTALSQRSAEFQLPVAAVIVDPAYDAGRYVHDVALIQLAAPVVPTAQQHSIALPLTQDAVTWPPVGTNATISGWGAQSAAGSANSDQLLAATVQVLADGNGTCGAYGTQYVGSSHLCAGVAGGGIDTCQGDSGGPLVVDVAGTPTLAGVTSVGQGCAEANYPGLYTRTAAMLPWIRQYVQLAATPPAAPTSVTAIPRNGGEAQVAWAPGAGADGTTIFTATAAPGGATCQSSGNTCVVAGLAPGTAYTFVVQGTNALGVGAASAPSGAIPAVNATGKARTSVKTSRIASWAKVPAAGVKVTSSTPSRCTVSGTAVKLLTPGMCRLSAKSGKKSGKAYIAVW